MSGSYRSAIWKTQLALLICGSLPGCKDTTASVEGPRRIVRRRVLVSLVADNTTPSWAPAFP